MGERPWSTGQDQPVDLRLILFDEKRKPWCGDPGRGVQLPTGGEQVAFVVSCYTLFYSSNPPAGIGFSEPFVDLPKVVP